MGRISKLGLFFLALGLGLLFCAWLIGFYNYAPPDAIFQMLRYAILGGIILAGAALAMLGALFLFV